MTMALCLNCGEMKFGAICPCPKCGTESTGDMQLDIAFSDHNYETTTLRQLGGVIKEIHAHCADPTKCFWAFIQYISQNHPEILGVNLKPEVQKDVEAILADCTIPQVVVEDSAKGRLMKEQEEAKQADLGDKT